MKTNRQNLRAGQTLLALAVIAAIGQAQAQTPPSEAVKALTTPDSSISIGAAGVSGDPKDRAQWAIYNGMREDSGYLLFDIDYLTRNNLTGMWVSVIGRNLGLDNRELRGEMQKQGDWKVFGEYNQIIRVSPFTVNTAMTDAGSTRPNVVRLAVAGTGTDIDFKTERKAGSAGFEKWLSPNLRLEASMKSEDKDGTRMWGRGYDCAAYVCGSSTTTAVNQANFLKNAILMIPEPIHSNIKQFDVKLAFHDEKLSVTAAYYGSLYTNDNGNISPIVPNSLFGGNGALVPALYPAVGTNIIAGGGMSLQDVLQSPLALPPDNQAHQFSVAGNYAFTPSTRATFKYAFTRATQNEDYVSSGFTGAPGVSNLDGRVDTIAAQMALTSRVTRDLNLLANATYMRKDDQTPNALYNVEAKAIFPATIPVSYTNVNQIGVPGAVWNNNHVSNTRMLSKLEASYRLPENFRVTVGLDYDLHERLVPESRVEEALGGLGPLREKNTETGYRIELRRSMSDSLNGSIQYANSQRDGSDWTNLSTLNPGSPTVITPSNTYLINTYCGGRECYGQVLPAESILGLNPNTPFPSSMADVQREKWKVTLDWMPADNLSVQFLAMDGKDTNEMPVDPSGPGKGWRESSSSFYSIDMSYAISEAWKMTAYASLGEQNMLVNHSTGYMMDLTNRNDAYGFSISGAATKTLFVGANVTYMNEENKYGTAASTGTTGTRLLGGITATPPSATNLAQAAIGLPDVTYRKSIFSVFGVYNMNKQSDLRIDLAYSKYKYDDWVWGQGSNLFVFGDNTSVKQQVDQDVTYVGLMYVYKFR